MDVVLDNFDLLLDGFWLTVQLFVISAIASLVLGMILAAMRVSPVGILRKTGGLYVTFFRNTPLLILFILVVAGLPKVGFSPPFLVKGCIALSFYTAAFVCEALRSGINSVPLGQSEAARSIGLTFGQSIREVVMPQAVRASVPPTVSVFIALVKNTSVAAAFGLLEATARMRGLSKDFPNDVWWIFGTVAIGYIIIVEILSFGANRLERRWRVAR